MPQPAAPRKPDAPRVVFSVAMPADDEQLIRAASEVCSESRNEFVRVAAVNRAKQVLADEDSRELRLAVRRSVDRRDPESATA